MGIPLSRCYGVVTEKLGYDIQIDASLNQAAGESMPARMENHILTQVEGFRCLLKSQRQASIVNPGKRGF